MEHNIKFTVLQAEKYHGTHRKYMRGDVWPLQAGAHMHMCNLSINRILRGYNVLHLGANGEAHTEKLTYTIFEQCEVVVIPPGVL